MWFATHTVTCGCYARHKFIVPDVAKCPGVEQVGKHQVEHYTKLAGKEVAVDDLVTYVVKYMMDKGMSLDNTEGMIDSSVFPVNYFTLKQVREKCFP